MAEAERRLAAILSADVVGYSRLMAEDEAATIRTLRAYRDQIGALVREHRGRVVDSPGDNLLAEFPSALEAVSCAVEIQRVVTARNTALAPSRRMEFRIGVHLGDVVVEGDRIYGDGVNIAARLEGLSKPGGVCISGAVYEQVERKLTAELEDLGERTLKNVSRPVHVYGVKLVLAPSGSDAVESRLAGMDEPTVSGFSGRHAVAILPFDNLSGDPDQEYFADGLVEDLITRLSSGRWFPVIARNSSFTYKGKPIKVEQVSRELGARYIVEGSVRRAGDRLRVTAQLIDATTGRHLWAERYDRDLRDLFRIQDEITEAIASSIEPALWHSEWQRTLPRKPEDLDAWESYSRGLWHFRQRTADENARARSFFRRAAELDPYSSWAFACISLTHQADVLYQWSNSPIQSIAEQEQAARKAIALDDSEPLAYQALGASYRITGRMQEAISAFEQALQLNPSLATTESHLGVSLAMMGRPDEAIAHLESALRLSPQDLFLHEFLFGVSVAHFAAGRYQDAVDWARRSLDRQPTSLVYGIAAASHAQLGNLDEARNALREGQRLTSEYTVAAVKLISRGCDEDVSRRLLDGLRKAGMRE